MTETSKQPLKLHGISLNKSQQRIYDAMQSGKRVKFSKSRLTGYRAAMEKHIEFIEQAFHHETFMRAAGKPCRGLEPRGLHVNTPFLVD